MCGINGFIDFAKTRDKVQIEDLVGRMNDKIVYRGPDDSGVFVENHIGIGMRRLSIIDLSGGHQPMFNMDKTLAVVFNGEIYNFKDLREELIAKGYEFRTTSDTEVIIYAYQEYGTACFAMFDGMFAIAIYDIAKQEVILGRDKAGEKPLYYYSDSKIFLFGSELKSLMCTGLISRKIDQQALHYYFTLTYIPAPFCIYEGVAKLEAGYYLRINTEGVVEKKQYWDLVYDKNNLIEDYEECKKALRQALFASVESRMISDVPIGAFMSGGIDSTTIAGIMSQISDKPINTFTIGFDEKAYDESSLAEIAAKKFGSKHYVETFSQKKALNIIDTVLDNMDEPFADSSALPTYFVSHLATQQVKVVLTGDCGDELFAGYSKYLIGYYSDLYNKVPSVLRKGFENYGIKMLPTLSNTRRKVEKVARNSRENAFTQRLHLMQLGCNDVDCSRLIENASTINSDMITCHYNKYKGKTDELSQTLYTDFKVVLEGDMFTKVDRMSMLNSLETRTPMISSRMLDVATRIPTKYKINRKEQKIIFKDTFKDILPQELLTRSKMGFGIPLDYWFRNELKEELAAKIEPAVLARQGIFNPEYAKNIFDEHQQLKENNKFKLWAIYVFQRWYEREFSV